jgi:NAD(P)-dependent dehydrogenase (short-subunit alcohol dehydrogenase family)
MIGIDLSGRAALVTGSTRGIGRAIIQSLADAGAKVVVCARTEEHVRDTVRELGGESVAVGMPADLSDPAQAQGLVDFAVQRHGRLDILVNNAVTSVQNTFEALSDEDWSLHIQSKLAAYVRMCRVALPHLALGGHGRIVNIAGMSARIVTDFRMTNGAVNAAVTNFSKHLAQQCGKRGITVNAVHPGLTWTPRLQQGLIRWAELDGIPEAQERAQREAEIPIGRFLQPQDIAHLVAFLSSGLAAAITGQAIAVDGGSGRGVTY